MTIRDRLARMKESERRNAERIAAFNQRARVRVEGCVYVCTCGEVLTVDAEADEDMPRTCPECGALLDYTHLYD